MASNDTTEMQRMQQDAIRRVQEMQNRAQQTLNRTQNPAPPPEPPAKEQHPHTGQQQQSAPVLPQLPPQLQPEGLSNLFDGLLQDGERTLILVLILILVSEKADTGLIFALMYLVI